MLAYANASHDFKFSKIMLSLLLQDSGEIFYGGNANFVRISDGISLKTLLLTVICDIILVITLVMREIFPLSQPLQLR